MMPHRGRSLRLKLTLWYLLAFSLVQFALIALVAISRADAFRETSMTGALRSAEAMADSILVKLPDWTSEDLQRLVPADSGFVLCAVRDATGEVLAQWNVHRLESLPFTAWESKPSGPLVPVATPLVREHAVLLAGIDAPLVLVTVQFRKGGAHYFLQAAVRDGLLQRFRGPFLDLAQLGIPIGMAAALAAAWWIAGRAVAPIRRLSDAARAVSPQSLGEPIRVFTTDEEIARLQEELNSALQRLEAGFKAQEQFISDVSHELKTPIAVLLTQAQVARMGTPRRERLLEFAAEVEREMQQLGRLVESFLAIARAGMPQGMPADPVPLNDLLLDSMRDCRALAVRRAVRLVPRLVPPRDDAPEPELTGDAQLLRTMLDNLLRNAIRHSPTGAPVEIEAEAANGEARIAVRDLGPGIPVEHLELIFERFVRLSRDGDPPGGSGLGLSIARQIATLHRGTIEVASPPGGGCTFTVRLPTRARET